MSPLPPQDTRRPARGKGRTTPVTPMCACSSCARAFLSLLDQIGLSSRRSRRLMIHTFLSFISLPKRWRGRRQPARLCAIRSVHSSNGSTTCRDTHNTQSHLRGKPTEVIAVEEWELPPLQPTEVVLLSHCVILCFSPQPRSPFACHT